MDFTEKLKEDMLSAIPSDKPLREAYLAGVTKNSAYVEIYKKAFALTYEFASKEQALALLPLIREASGEDVFFVQKGAQGEKNYKIQLKDAAADKLLAVLHLSRYGEFVPDNGVEYLKSLDTGAFYCYLSGTVLVAAKLRFPDDKTSNYSLQFNFSDKEYSEAFREKLLDFGVDMKLSESKTGYTLLSRNSAEIEEVLAMCKANNCVFALNDVLIKRETDNDFNRMSNFYMANYNKSVESNKKYIDAVKVLQNSGDIELLDSKLRNVAVARVENEDATMQELADRLSMSKTSLSRALNKILAFANGENDGRK